MRHSRANPRLRSRRIDRRNPALGGTDTLGFQNTRRARPVDAIPVPTRYLHTGTETVHEDDVDATIGLLTAFLETGDGEYDDSL